MPSTAASRRAAAGVTDRCSQTGRAQDLGHQWQGPTMPSPIVAIVHAPVVASPEMRWPKRAGDRTTSRRCIRPK
jgi:hypothetical protein